MNQILKRLELIKTAIDIDDEEIIELQIMKLKKIEIDAAVISILDKLENIDYGSVVLDIEEYLSRFSGVMVYEDKEAQGLKLELKALEKKLHSLSEQKREYLNDIDEFNTLYHLKLGAIIQEILKLKKDLLEKEIESKNRKYKEEKSLHVDTQNIFDEMQSKIEELEEFLEDMDEDDEQYEEINQVYEELKENLKELEEELQNQKETIEELEDDLTGEEFERTKADYEEFREEYEDIKKESVDIHDISEDEKAKLKKLYRKASRLCHPDIVVDELKEQAHEIMQALNAAYSKKDIKTVQKILKNLEKGIAFDVASDKIDDKRILKAKVEELREKIDEITDDIEAIKQDDTFETICELDDWDEYFESMKYALEEEKETLLEQVNVVVLNNTSANNEKEIEGWIQKLWDWADENNIPNGKLSRKKENLLTCKTIDFTGIKLNYLPEEIKNLDAIATLVLWDCDLAFLPKEIVKFTKLKKLNIRGNPRLSITRSQEQWIESLMKHASVFKDTVAFIDDDTLSDWEKNQKIPRETSHNIENETSKYAEKIEEIQLPNFEKIRKYCVNLDNGDNLNSYLAENGKMHKAFIYSALDEFLEELDTETINLIDWGCDQGISSMLVLDYIREKQLDIKVSQVILIDNDVKALNRASIHIEVLKQNSTKITLINTKENNCLNKISNTKNNITLNLFVNNKIPIDLQHIDYSVFGEMYFLCVSNGDSDIVDKIYQQLDNVMDIKDVSIKDTKIGKYKKYEKIFSNVTLRAKDPQWLIDANEVLESIADNNIELTSRTQIIRFVKSGFSWKTINSDGWKTINYIGEALGFPYK